MGEHFSAEKRGVSVTQNKNDQYAASLLIRFDDNIKKRVTEEESTLQEAVHAVIDRINARLVGLQRAMVSLSVGPVEIELAVETAPHGGSLD